MMDTDKELVEKELLLVVNYCYKCTSVVHMMDDMGDDLTDDTFAAGTSGDRNRDEYGE